MRKLLLLGALFAGAVTLSACPPSSAFCDQGICDDVGDGGGKDGQADGQWVLDGASADGSSPADGSTVDAPPGCDLKADPKDSPACVADSVGVFVDGTGGLDTNDGTKAHPYQTIAKAVTSNASQKPRIYVCAGTYPENISLDQAHAASIYGGFACGGWSYATSNAVTIKPTSGYALDVASVTSAVTVADVEMEAPDGSAGSVHSIAAFVHDSPSVTMKRAKLVAGTGFSPGKAGDPALNYSGMNASAGVTAPNATGGQLVAGACTCTDGTNARGGNGGGAAAAVAGAPPLGAGQAGTNNTKCNMGGLANDGNNANALMATPAPAKVGALTASGWVASTGTKGANGGPGQGGGGGGNGANGTGGGGSGACGGCGGCGGLGGAGGGASIALLTFNAPVSLVASTLTSGKAGDGATGSDAQGGQGGGFPAGSGYFVPMQGVANIGCTGGNGGTGAGGNGGGGGAAGVSFAVLSSGAVPTKDSSTTLNAGTVGAVGTGGKAGDTGPGAANAGQPGGNGPTSPAAAQKRAEDL